MSLGSPLRDAILNLVSEIQDTVDSHELATLMGCSDIHDAEAKIEQILRSLHREGVLRSCGRAYNAVASGFRIRYTASGEPGDRPAKKPRRRNPDVPRLEHWRIIAAIGANPGIHAGEILRKMGYGGAKTGPSESFSRIAYLRLKQSLLALSTAGRIRWKNGTNANGQQSRAYFLIPTAAPACPGCGRYLTRAELRRLLEMSISSAPAPGGSDSPQTDAGPDS